MLSRVWRWFRSATPQGADDVKTSLKAAAREFFKAWSPRIVATAATGAVAARVAVGGWSWGDLAVAGGILAFWPFQEWLIHVFLLHFKPRKVLGITIDPLVAREHRRHHEDPWKIDAVFVPLPAVFFTLPAVSALWWTVMPTRELALTGMATFATMGLVYEWTHYLIHSRYRPRSAWYKQLWTNHRLHHCKNEHYWYGVTMMAGDRVLGTAPDEKAVARSETCRTIIEAVA